MINKFQSAGEHGMCRQPAIIDDDGDVVIVVHLDIQGFLLGSKLHEISFAWFCVGVIF
jgi:hypothetical protein